ncbi:GNAT family N-acetyltransferase [Nocardia sp. SYP-A9097]|uniref:GNAT family N-acetyltransferase n=1 Tax=Nocardia sp. SYP-A9097 TaxID=2663237 RepID=UPI00129A20D2|nr:GNAT family N-acetyltransferase [Nocardia sp. SYP-A9097]MRH90683.1 GNAT family N-acetyltransferase [Nocardia sp. SYP-A9097]
MRLGPDFGSMGGMGWNFTEDVEQYLEAAGEFLRSRPAECNVALTVSATVAAGNKPAHPNPPLFGWLSRDGRVGGAIVHTPPFPLGLFGLAGADTTELVAALENTGRGVDHVVGPAGVVQAFADATQRGFEVVEQQLLYRLGGLVAPRPTAGRARLAQQADREVLEDFTKVFADEDTSVPFDQVGERLSYNGIWLWEVDGQPVSVASLSRSVAGIVRVGLVATPPEHRGHGYAAAVTHHVSQVALDTGNREVLLFTDRSNPTSNGIYQRLGYEVVEEQIQMRLGATH